MDEHAQTAGNFLDNRHDAERRIAALEAELAEKVRPIMRRVAGKS